MTSLGIIKLECHFSRRRVGVNRSPGLLVGKLETWSLEPVNCIIDLRISVTIRPEYFPLVCCREKIAMILNGIDLSARHHQMSSSFMQPSSGRLVEFVYSCAMATN